MADARETVFDIHYPLWVLADRAHWLAAGFPDSVTVFKSDHCDKTIILFTDEHQAIRFLDDSRNPLFCTILLRDRAELLALVRDLPAQGINHVNFDPPHPNSGRPDRSWITTVPELVTGYQG